jgi:hypothetical protein
MPDFTMKVIPKPPEGSATVLMAEPQFPPIPLITGEGEGEGDVNLLCGKCGFTVVKTVQTGAIRGGVLVCNSCGAYNENPM